MAPPATTAYIGLGANLGDTRATLAAALAVLSALPGCSGLRVSSLWRTAPVDSGGPDYLNAVAVLQTTLAPLQLLDALQVIEQRFGRERPHVNAPRTLDLDLLMHGDAVIDTARLTLPHPRLHQRAFVLQPLLELAPALQAPGLGPLAAHLGATAGQRAQRLSEAAGTAAYNLRVTGL